MRGTPFKTAQKMRLYCCCVPKFFTASVASLSHILLYSLSACPFTFRKLTLCRRVRAKSSLHRSSFNTGLLSAFFHPAFSHAYIQPLLKAFTVYAESLYTRAQAERSDAALSRYSQSYCGYNAIAGNAQTKDNRSSVTELAAEMANKWRYVSIVIEKGVGISFYTNGRLAYCYSSAIFTGATTGGRQSPRWSPCAMIRAPISLVDTPQLEVYAYFKAPSLSRNFMSNALAKF